jgi:integrase
MSHVEAYLTYRRSNGYTLSCDETQLRSFARFADDAKESEHMTVSLAEAWALTSPSNSQFTLARRFEILRGFARFCLQHDPATEIPPRAMFGSSHRRLLPHIYTQLELSQLLEVASHLTPKQGLRPATCRCVFGLLAASGLRISEALALTRKDADLTSGILHIRDAKFHKSRLVPLHASTIAKLVQYNLLRDHIVSKPISQSFFLRDDGHSANQEGMLYALQSLCQQLDWQPRGDYTRHRLHDFRHSFIVRSMLHFYTQGVDIDSAILALSTYVGHAKVSDTYWYLTGIPELMAIATERFQRYANEVST